MVDMNIDVKKVLQGRLASSMGFDIHIVDSFFVQLTGLNSKTKNDLLWKS